MKYRSFRRFGMLLATALPACGAPEESEWLGSTGVALTGTDLTPTSIANVSDLRNVPAGAEGLDKVFDNNTATKLYLRHSSETIQYRMAKPSTIVSYDIKSGNDHPERDPKNWTFEGSLDGLGWVELDRRDEQVFTARQQTRSYTFTNSTAYLYYRLNISDNQGDNGDMQLSEFRVGGTQASGTLPGTPAIASRSVSGNAITLNWSTASNATAYYVQRIADNGNGAVEFLVSGTSYTDSNLSPGTSYLYQIQAVNGTLRGLPSARSARIATALPAAPAKDVTALSSFAVSDQYGTTGVEGAAKVTDNNPYSKYYTPNATTYVTLQTTAGAVVTQYTLTSANDYPARDPKSWTLQGSSDGISWTPLDTRTNQSFIGRFQKRTYTCNPSALPFNTYRLVISGNQGAFDTQLAEWRLLGTVSTSLAAPAAPSSLAATTLSSNQIKLTWVDNASQLNPEASYSVDRATNSSFTTNLVTTALGANSTEFRATALAPSQTYYFRVRASNAAGSSSVLGPVNATTPANSPPTSWVENGWYSGHHRTVYRTYLDSHVAVYFDEHVPNRTSITWLNPVISEAWSYVKNTYGGFSDPILYVIGNQDHVPGDDIYNVAGLLDAYNPEGYYRNVAFSPSGDWSDEPDWSTAGPEWNFGALTHEIGHIVEFSNNATNGSPSFDVWEDSKWADIFGYDVYLHLTTVPGAAAAAKNRADLMTNTGNYGRYWFRDWHYPLYNGDFGNTAAANKGTAFLVKYFQLLKQHYPKINSSYGRAMNYGEFVHFCAGAAGVDLEDEAKIAFGYPAEVELQLARAQQEFPAVHALYGGGGGGNVAPVFSANPINRSATVNVALSGQTLVGTATDANAGDTLTFSKESGATWLSVASNGTLSGAPPSAGTSTAVVRVTDQGGLYASATLSFTVGGAGALPCDGLCTGAVTFSNVSYNSGNLGTAATCHQTSANLQAALCGNFAAGRTFRVNNTLVSCSGTITLPAKRNGGYCFQASAGNHAWAYFATY